MGCMANNDDRRQRMDDVDDGDRWGFGAPDSGVSDRRTPGDRSAGQRVELTDEQREQIERAARQGLAEAEIIASTRGQVRNSGKLRDMEAAVQRTEKFATVMDKYMIDPIAGIFVGAGDVVTSAAGLYIVAEALNAGVPPGKIFHMLVNIGIDFLGGSIPVLGDIFDFLYKSNKKNAKLFRDYFEKLEREETRGTRRRSRPSYDEF